MHSDCKSNDFFESYVVNYGEPGITNIREFLQPYCHGWGTSYIEQRGTRRSREEEEPEKQQEFCKV